MKRFAYGAATAVALSFISFNSASSEEPAAETATATATATADNHETSDGAHGHNAYTSAGTILTAETASDACNKTCGDIKRTYSGNWRTPQDKNSECQCVHWTYSEAGKWGDEFPTCKSGQEQSPINITEAATDVDLPPITFDYAAQGNEIVNNGHTVQVNIPSYSITVGSETYKLLQFHFHERSEHQIGGEWYAMEMHLVHRSDAGKLAVVGVMLKEDTVDNPNLAPIWAHLPSGAGEHPTKETQGFIELATLLPESKDYYTYNGSLTTPPCSEGVKWIVLKKPIKVGQGQLTAWKTLMVDETSRPLQQLNARTVQK